VGQSGQRSAEALGVGRGCGAAELPTTERAEAQGKRVEDRLLLPSALYSCDVRPRPRNSWRPPRNKGHDPADRLGGISPVTTREIEQGRAHFDWGIALYDPSEEG
jgi:hypothetical protein